MQKMSDLDLMICVDTILAIIIAVFLIESLIEEDICIDEDIRRAKKIDETLKKIAEILKKYKESEEDAE